MYDDKRLGVGIDVGTNTVRAVVGATKLHEIPQIIGYGEAVNHGMRKGTIINIDQTANAIDRALATAEKMADTRIMNATVSANGQHIFGQISHGVVAVAGKEVGEDDILRVERAASTLQLGENREILDVTIRSFILGGQASIKNPLGMLGARLEADSYVISGLVPHIRNLEKALLLTELPKTNLIPSGLAAAQVVLNQAQKESGVAVIDIGGTTTNLVVYDEGELYHAAILPVGGNNVTNDLAIGLMTDIDIAEQVKLNYAVATSSQRKTGGRIKITKNDQDYTFETSLVDKIVEARMAEIFELVNVELSKIDRRAKLPAGVVLTGGGAQLAGIEASARETIRLNAKLGQYPNFGGKASEVAGPEWATALGLMMVDIKDDIAVNKPKPTKPKKFGFGKKAK
ncbi:MAG: cell division protein FtsA [Candidatus Nomurabacteria bacterium]|jgi:cell division protein FtsA|nr:cell division protein FtsA [Candidatus Nomurabacteria bacterium]